MINQSIGLIGVALQSDKSTAAEQPTYVHGLTGGSVFSMERSMESTSVACGVRAGADNYVSEILPGADYEHYGYADVLPLYLYAALGKIESKQQEGEPDSGYYDHSVSIGDALPYLTLWGRTGDEYTRLEGSKLDAFSMEFEGNSPLAFGATFAAIKGVLGVENIPGEITPSCFDGYFIPTDGEFLLDTGSAVPTASADVMSGSIELSNETEPSRAAGKVMPSDIAEGKLVVSGAVTVKPDDLKLYKKVITGDENGTDPTGKVVYGSIKWTFKHSVDEKMSFVVEIGKIPFTAEFPEVDPEGSGAEIEFSWDNIGLVSADESPIKFTVTNKVAQYVGA